MQGNEVFRWLLELESPWLVREVRISPAKSRIEIWIDIEHPKRHWWFGRQKQREAHERVWRHVNFGDYRTVIHVRHQALSEAPPPVQHRTFPEREGALVSAGLEQQIRQALLLGNDEAAVTKLFDVSPNELGQVRRALGQVTQVNKAPKSDPVSMLPGLGHPNWGRLLDNEIQLNIRNLGLQMLLHRLQMQLREQSDIGARLARIEELRSYFVKYHRLMKHEINQLFGEERVA